MGTPPNEATRRRTNLRAVIDDKFQGSQADFARAIGRSESQVSQWMHALRNMSESVARDIEQKVHLARGSLDAFAQDSPLISAAESLRKIPVLEWGDVVDMRRKEGPALTSPSGKAREVMLTSPDVSPRAFALRVTGDSMSPLIPAGARVLIEPARSPVAGSVVLALLPGDLAPVLRRLVLDQGQQWLRADNPAYPSQRMPANGAVLGVAIRVETALE